MPACCFVARSGINLLDKVVLASFSGKMTVGLLVDWFILIFVPFVWTNIVIFFVGDGCELCSNVGVGVMGKSLRLEKPIGM